MVRSPRETSRGHKKTTPQDPSICGSRMWEREEALRSDRDESEVKGELRNVAPRATEKSVPTGDRGGPG